MITLLRGAAAALDAHCARLAAESDLALPVFPPVAPRCWNGVRNLLAGVARRRGAGAGTAVASATMFTFFHEMGHTLIDIYDLPVTGREEDAVDHAERCPAEYDRMSRAWGALLVPYVRH